MSGRGQLDQRRRAQGQGEGPPGGLGQEGQHEVGPPAWPGPRDQHPPGRGALPAQGQKPAQLPVHQESPLAVAQGRAVAGDGQEGAALPHRGLLRAQPPHRPGGQPAQGQGGLGHQPVAPGARVPHPNRRPGGQGGLLQAVKGIAPARPGAEVRLQGGQHPQIAALQGKPPPVRAGVGRRVRLLQQGPAMAQGQGPQVGPQARLLPEVVPHGQQLGAIVLGRLALPRREILARIGPSLLLLPGGAHQAARRPGHGGVGRRVLGQVDQRLWPRGPGRSRPPGPGTGPKSA